MHWGCDIEQDPLYMYEECTYEYHVDKWQYCAGSQAELKLQIQRESKSCCTSILSILGGGLPSSSAFDIFQLCHTISLSLSQHKSGGCLTWRSLSAISQWLLTPLPRLMVLLHCLNETLTQLAGSSQPLLVSVTANDTWEYRSWT